MPETLLALPNDAPHRRTVAAKRVLVRCIEVLACLCGAAGLLAFISRFSSSGSHVVLILAVTTPTWTLAALLGSGLLAAVRSWKLLVPVAAVSATLIGVQLPLYVGDGAKLDPPRSIQLMTGNLKLGTADPAGIVVLAVRHNADVLTLQELTYAEADRLRAAGLDRAYPYSIVAPDASAAGVGIWSKSPISHQQRHGGLNFNLVSAEIQVGGEPVSFVSSHLAGPFPQSSKSWVSDIANLGPILQQLPGPVVDGGDFNATTDQAQFRHLLDVSHTTDAAEESGAAPIFSYPADRALIPPFIAIDHVLLRGLNAERVSTVTMPGSDHRGLIADIGFRR